jgi:hypothetical protein
LECADTAQQFSLRVLVSLTAIASAFTNEFTSKKDEKPERDAVVSVGEDPLRRTRVICRVVGEAEGLNHSSAGIRESAADVRWVKVSALQR